MRIHSLHCVSDASKNVSTNSDVKRSLEAWKHERELISGDYCRLSKSLAYGTTRLLSCKCNLLPVSVVELRQDYMYSHVFVPACILGLGDYKQLSNKHIWMTMALFNTLKLLDQD